MLAVEPGRPWMITAVVVSTSSDEPRFRTHIFAVVIERRLVKMATLGMCDFRQYKRPVYILHNSLAGIPSTLESAHE